MKRMFTYRVEDSAHYRPDLRPEAVLYVAMNEKGEDVMSSPDLAIIQEYCRQHTRRLAEEDAMALSRILRTE